jgi:hypothetical protein
VIQNTPFGSHSYHAYSANIANRHYEPGLKATLGLKDLLLASEAAVEASHPLPMLAAVHGRMANTVAAGLAEQVWSAIEKFTTDSADQWAVSIRKKWMDTTIVRKPLNRRLPFLDQAARVSRCGRCDNFCFDL